MLARPGRRAPYHRALRRGELIPQNEWELRHSAESGMLKGDPLTRGAMLALPITSSGEWRTHSSEWEGTLPLRRERHYHRALGGGETRTLRRERHAHRWPSNEGSNASSTYNELWRAENSFLGMRGTQLPMRRSRAENSLLRVRGNSDAPKGAACS